MSSIDRCIGAETVTGRKISVRRSEVSTSPSPGAAKAAHLCRRLLIQAPLVRLALLGRRRHRTVFLVALGPRVPVLAILVVAARVLGLGEEVEVTLLDRHDEALLERRNERLRLLVRLCSSVQVSTAHGPGRVAKGAPSWARVLFSTRARFSPRLATPYPSSSKSSSLKSSPPFLRLRRSLPSVMALARASRLSSSAASCSLGGGQVGVSSYNFNP